MWLWPRSANWHKPILLHNFTETRSYQGARQPQHTRFLLRGGSSAFHLKETLHSFSVAKANIRRPCPRALGTRFSEEPWPEHKQRHLAAGRAGLRAERKRRGHVVQVPAPGGRVGIPETSPRCSEWPARKTYELFVSGIFHLMFSDHGD